MSIFLVYSLGEKHLNSKTMKTQKFFYRFIQISIFGIIAASIVFVSHPYSFKDKSDYFKVSSYPLAPWKTYSEILYRMSPVDKSWTTDSFRYIDGHLYRSYSVPSEEISFNYDEDGTLLEHIRFYETGWVRVDDLGKSGPYGYTRVTGVKTFKRFL